MVTQTMPRFIYDGARWFLVALLILAPWVYGSAPKWAYTILAELLLALIVVFCAACILRRSRPRVPVLPAILTVILLGYGWFMAWNARASFDLESWRFTSVVPHWPGWPSALDFRSAADILMRLTGMAGAFWVVCDLCARPIWVRRIWNVVALTGVSIAWLGLIQRATGATSMFWDHEVIPAFFATYRYHANAGTFLNLVFPFIACRAALAFVENQSNFLKTFWVMNTLALIAAALVNTSRGALAVTILLGLVLLVWQIAFWWKRRQEISRALIAYYVIVALLILGFFAWAVGLDKSFSRITTLGIGDLVENQRFIVYGVIKERMLPYTGWWGFGPGSFYPAFPYYTADMTSEIPGLWRYAHHDYLQALVEWGRAGTIGWIVLLYGGLAVALVRLVRFGKRLRSPDRLLLAAAAFSLTGILIHAFFDFPLQIASLQLYTAVALGFAWTLGTDAALRQRREKSPSPESPPELSPKNPD